MAAANEPGSSALASEQPEQSRLYVVGIGASAGGLSALQALLHTFPANPGFACVVVMHLAPNHESHLAELLQQHTPMPVRQVTATIPLEPNQVYVIPPNANLNTIDTHLRLSELEERRIQRAPIDHFLRTLGATHDGTAIGVILTGGGSDGAIGLRYIKECGGLTIAQDPIEAQFDSMPRSAIASGSVDLVLPLSQIAAEILQYCGSQPQLPTPDGNDKLGARDNALLEEILRDLHNRTQKDFSTYRRASLLKRLRRRMQLRHVTTLAGYLTLLAQESAEADALANDLVLAPTEFFGDTASFLELEKKVIPEIMARKQSEEPRVRVWSIGCSTGEVAYSLAMLLIEHAAAAPRMPQLQVFASDLSDRLLGVARAGVYPREIAAAISPQRLERFFRPEPGFYRVKHELRDIVLFTCHDLFRDPPFARIDVIVCRTLLSDLQPDLRRGVLRLFHYALQPEGFLLVGSHDEVDTPGLFTRENEHTPLYRKISAAPHLAALPPAIKAFGAVPLRIPRAPVPADLGGDFTSLFRSAIEPYVPASALINASNEVLHFSPTAAKYILIPGGTLTNDLTRLVRDSLYPVLMGGLRTVRETSEPWSSETILVGTDDGTAQTILHLQPVHATDLILVVFDDCEADSAVDKTSASEKAGVIANLKVENRELRGRLHEFQDNGLPPQWRMEDAVHELHAALEQLAASKEELQATNEELIALDDENRRRVRELTELSTDLQHLLASSGIATLFLDRALNIVRFTPELGRLFKLRPSDLGRPVGDLASMAHYRELSTDASRVLESAETMERELRGADERCYLARLLPYRTAPGLVDGIVLTLIDITERKRAEQALQEASRHKDEFLALLAHELRNPLAPISAGVEVLKKAPGDSHIVERMAATMGRQTRQLVRLVDDLLEVSRINGGKLHLHMAPVDLKDVIEDALSSAKPAVQKAGHRLKVEVTQEALIVAGDAARLTQVISNLLSNAVRYTPTAGTIAVTATRQEYTAQVTVKDSGIGISRESLPHVFEMFYQGGNRSTTFGAGLGIGLTLAKTLVEMHGGSITASSDGPTHGSEFTIRLPLANVAVTPEPRAAADERPTLSGGHRILIVDDNIDAAETLCQLMKSLGEHEVHTVSSGAQALATGPDLLPDIVLLDLMMPEMDGYEVARRMRNEPWGKKMRLVALSGWGHEEHRRRAKEAGFDQHVTKPADLMALQKVLQESPPLL
jgi:two-component system CheB/CheR fusion protein